MKASLPFCPLLTLLCLLPGNAPAQENPAASSASAAAPVLAWGRQWGTPADDFGTAFVVDPAGRSFIAGHTTGKLVWSRQFGTPAPEQGMNVRVDAQHGLYVAGSSAGNLAAPALGGGDSVLLKLSPAGDLLWKRQFGTARWDGIHSLTLASDGTDRVIVGGCQNWDQCQGFLREFDPAGAELWSAVIPSTQLICGTQIAVDEAGHLYQTGGTHGPAFGEYHGSGNDIILVKLTPKPAPKT